MSSTSEPGEQRNSLSVDELLSKSGLSRMPKGFDFSSGRVVATLPEDSHVDFSVNDIEQIENQYGITASRKQQLIEEMGGKEKYDEWILGEMNIIWHLRNVGGVGITGRSYQEVVEEFPKLENLLKSIAGNVIILGNG